MPVNVWIALRDDAQAAIVEALDTPPADYQGPVPARTRRLFEFIGNRASIQRIFKKPTLGGRVYTLWDLMFDERGDVLQKLQDELDALAAQYPNQFVIAGAWHPSDGRQVGTRITDYAEVANPDYVGEPFEIPNPAYQPDPELEDYDPRETLRNPAWVPEFLSEPVIAGTPTYPLPAQLSQFMPDDPDGTPNPTLRDAHGYAGQAPRTF